MGAVRRAGMRPATDRVVVMTSGRVVLAATPIGNPADASDRLRQVLATADIVAARTWRPARVRPVTHDPHSLHSSHVHSSDRPTRAPKGGSCHRPQHRPPPARRR